MWHVGSVAGGGVGGQTLQPKVATISCEVRPCPDPRAESEQHRLLPDNQGLDCRACAMLARQRVDIQGYFAHKKQDVGEWTLQPKVATSSCEMPPCPDPRSSTTESLVTCSGWGSGSGGLRF